MSRSLSIGIAEIGSLFKKKKNIDENEVHLCQPSTEV